MPRVALTMRMTQTPHEWRDAIAQDWHEYLHAQGIRLTLVPNDPEQCLQYLEGVDALILSGGEEPVIRSKDEESDHPLARRDRTEFALLAEAVRKNLPVLGICRGLEFINISFGGTLKPVAGHVAQNHLVRIQGNQPLFPKQEMLVNSFHGLGIDTLAKDLVPFALTEQGDVEGVMHNRLPLAGIMWHPERAERQDGLITKFIQSF